MNKQHEEKSTYEVQKIFLDKKVDELENDIVVMD